MSTAVAGRTPKEGNERDGGAGCEHLQAAEPEHPAPQCGKAVERELEAEGEEQEDHAELAQALERARVVVGEKGEPGCELGEPPGNMGAGEHADEEKSGDLSDPEALQERDDDPG